MEIVTEKALAPIKARTTKMQSVVNALVIKDDEGMKEAANIRISIKSVEREVKERKEEITKPMNTALKNIRALFAPLEEACDEASRTVGMKIIAHNREIERVRQEQEAKLAARVDKGTMKIETAAKKMEALPEAQRHIASDKGSVTIAKIKKFKVVDISKLPVEYLLANEPEIRRAMYAGTELAGVEYFSEDSLR